MINPEGYYKCVDDVKTTATLSRPMEGIELTATFTCPVRIADMNRQLITVSLLMSPGQFTSHVLSRKQVMDLHEFFMRLEEELSRREKE